MSGHAVIFKTINVRQLQRMTEFHRISDNMTISEAYQLLEKGDSTVCQRTRAAWQTTQAKNSYFPAPGDNPNSIRALGFFSSDATTLWQALQSA